MSKYKGIDDLLAAGLRPRRLKAGRFFEKARARLFVPLPMTEPVVVGPEIDQSPKGVRPPFPVEVFPEPVARFAGRVAAAMGCPVDFPGLAVLVISGAAIGAARSIKIKGGWYEKPGMYAVIVSKPGTTKTPALKAVMNPVYEEQGRLYEVHKAELAEYKQALQASKQAQRGNQEGQAAPPLPEEPPPLRHLFANDTTVEELANNLQDNPKGILLFRDELTAWVRSLDQYKARGTDRQFFLSAWSGEMVKVDRKAQHGRPIIIRHPFVSVLGGIQPDLLNELEAEGGREDGFIHRVLFSCPPETEVKGWSDDEITEEDEREWRLVLNKLLNLEPLMVEGEGERPKSLTFDDEGRQAFITWYEAITQEMNDPDLPAELGGPYAKLRTYCARFALVIHLLRVGCGEAGSEQDEGLIDAEDVARAARLCDYFKAHLKVVYPRLQQSQEDKKVEGLLAWMKRKKLTSCTARDLCRNNVCGIKKASEAEKLLRAAADQGRGDWGSNQQRGKGTRVKDTSTFTLRKDDQPQPTPDTPDRNGITM